MSKVIAICGMAGSGKTEVSTAFENAGYKRIHFGVTELALEKFGETSEEIEKKLRVEVREQYGMGAMVVLAMDKIKNYLAEGHNVIIDNMYSWSEYKQLKDEFKANFATIAVHASPKIRYTRMAERNDGRNYTDPEVCKSRDYSEIENIEKGGPIAMADYHLINENIELSDLKKQVKIVIDQLNL